MLIGEDKDRAIGALLGAAAGDALGTTLEFSRPDVPNFPTKITGPLTEIVGGGPFRVVKGQVTDDTHMATCIARSLFEHGTYDVADMAKRYRAWRTVTFDCGGQTGGSISQFQTCPPGEEYQAGFKNWRFSRQAAGNGSLMRASPIGVFFVDNPEGRTRASVLDSAMTHADPHCILACAAYNEAIAVAVRGASVDRMFGAAYEGMQAALAFMREHPEIKRWFTPDELVAAQYNIHQDLVAARKLDPELSQKVYSSQGWVRVAFRYAFWALYHADNFEEAIIDVANRGGDADTNGAIAGGLLGSYFGASDIPPQWKDAVLNACRDTPESPWWTTYHPRFFALLTNARPATKPVVDESQVMRAYTPEIVDDTNTCS